MAIGKLGSKGGFGHSGAVLGSVKGGFGARLSAVATLVGSIRQSNLIGAALSGSATLAADISLSAGVSIGSILSGTASLAADALQINQIGSLLSGTASLAGDIASASAWDYDAEYMLNF